MAQQCAEIKLSPLKSLASGEGIQKMIDREQLIPLASSQLLLLGV